MLMLALCLYDTKSREVLAVPDTDGLVRMYCCGPTVYRDAHVGNMRTFLLSDLIRRTLKTFGYQVSIVQNITDVGHMSEDFEGEDKLLAQSKAEDIDPFSVAHKYEERFHSDLRHLNILPADRYPRASECIPLMQGLIAQLIARGNAYVGSDNSVYFDAATFPGYGQLSGNRLDSLKPGHRYEYRDDGGKKFHADWALWKAAGDRTEMIWDSPWGPGFPGWHIECSAMSLHFLDGHVNVHVGGIDLRFPHHEDERAQSNVITGNETVDLWVHGEHLLFQGRKMSKSAGNVVLTQDIIDRGLDPLALRLVFLENRYRSQMDLTWETITAANETLRKWRTLVGNSPTATPLHNEEISSALSEDLDTPRAIQVIRALIKDPTLSDEMKAGHFLYADQVLGLDLGRVEVPKEMSAETKKILDQRDLARAKKNWAESDRLRGVLEDQGLIIKDSSTGQEWQWR
jgi:cysteinyl-tRNA synthetase